MDNRRSHLFIIFMLAFIYRSGHGWKSIQSLHTRSLLNRMDALSSLRRSPLRNFSSHPNTPLVPFRIPLLAMPKLEKRGYINI